MFNLSFAALNYYHHYNIVDYQLFLNEKSTCDLNQIGLISMCRYFLFLVSNQSSRVLVKKNWVKRNRIV